MITLCMDTSHKYLVLAILKDNVLIDGVMTVCWKKQSELILPEIDKMMRKNQFVPTDIDSIVITDGPGSFTGVRIAMTIAKVIGSLTDVKVYTISTLKLYAGNLDAIVMLDARGGRCYFGIYHDHIGHDEIVKVEDVNSMIDSSIKNIIGDASLIGKVDNYPSIVDNFLLTKAFWTEVKDINALTPVYLKEKSEYIINI